MHADLNLKGNQRLRDDPCIHLESTEEFAMQLFDAAARFFRLPKVELPGFVILSMGFIDILGWRMAYQAGTLSLSKGQSFLDDDFGADTRHADRRIS